jgi:[ribosomal protein S5]-alanine N-acetyltransferase
MFHVEQKLNFQVSPFPVIKTDRLVLREIVHSDLQEFFLIRSNEAICAKLDRHPIKTIHEASSLIEFIGERFQREIAINWAISLKGHTKLIGYIGFHKIDHQHHRAEIGYALFEDYYRTGIMFEAASAAISYAFNQIGLHSMEANLNPLNKASENILIKLGFSKEAHFNQNYFFNGVYLDSLIYSLINPKH